MSPAEVGIDDVVRPSIDEYARQCFVGALRNHAMADMRESLRVHYEEKVRPEFEQRTGQAPATARDIERLMQNDLYYRFYSSLRYNAQEMAWLSVQPPIERVLPELIALAADVARRNPAGGSLRLDPGLEIPRYVSAQDVHLVPGCFHSEFTENDVAQGAVMAHGGRVCTSANVHRKDNPGGVAIAIGYWLTRQYPSFTPRRILDLGTSSGKNLVPYLDTYPGAEAHGLDISAPLLRYGHARAEQQGRVVHFSQQNAEHPDYPDGYFDLIVSSFFFHEVPVVATRRILAQCHRMLAPAGMMVHMELPPHQLCDAWRNFAWDWDTKNNNEPSYTAFRSQDPLALCVGAGFAAERVIQTHIPDITKCGAERFERLLKNELPMPRHGAGSWFVFGAAK
jgi:ubiquinone/menaquinone biosynthesis C-methylase UbiE